MAVPFSNNKLRVPHGFQALLEGMAREILYNQPPDIYAFSALYFENLLNIRAGGNPDPVTKYAQIEDRTSNNRAFQVSENNSGMEDEQNAAVTIQTKYRQHQAKATADDLRQYNAAVKIQASVRGHITRKRMQTNRDTDQDEYPDEQVSPDEDDDIELSDSQGQGRLPAELPVSSPQPLTDSPAPLSAKLNAEDELAESNEETEAVGESQPQVPEAETADVEISDDVGQLDLAEPLPEENVKQQETDAASEIVDDEGKSKKFTERVDDDMEVSEKPAAEPADDEVEVGDKPAAEPADDEVEVGDKPAAEPPDDEVEVGDEPAAEQAVEETRLSVADEEIDKAASKIQAGFRGMKTRRELAELVSTKAAEVPVEIEDDKAEVLPEDALPAEGENDTNTEQSADLEHLAASKIQAGFRGMKTRRELLVLKQIDAETALDEEQSADADAGEATVADASEEAKPEESKETESGEVAAADNEPADEVVAEQPLVATAPSDDEDADTINRAAGKIQAGFRGMAARKQIRELKEQLQQNSPSNEGEVDPTVDAEAADDPALPDVESQVSAASKILAGIEGMKARRGSAEEKADDVKADADVDGPAEEKEAEAVDQLTVSQEAAALKIQAALAGHKTRNNMDILESTAGLDAEVTIADSELDVALDEPGNPETARDSVDPEIARLMRESVEPETAREDPVDEPEIVGESDDLEVQDKPVDEAAGDVVMASDAVPTDGDDASENDGAAGDDEELE